MSEIERIAARIEVIHSDPANYFGQRSPQVVPQPVDQAWMALVLQWLRAWTFTPAQAEHLMVIIRGQTKP